MMPEIVNGLLADKMTDDNPLVSKMFKRVVQRGPTERRGEAVHTPLRVNRSLIEWGLANGETPSGLSLFA